MDQLVEEMLGTSPAIHAIFGLIHKMAKTDLPVLVTGEAGTGKEVTARAIHARSPRAQGPFGPINCGAIPETLLESELFGHERGAFTGAVHQKKGKLEAAVGGTVFLDEVGDLLPVLQVKLLRFLQQGTFERVGGARDPPRRRSYHCRDQCGPESGHRPEPVSRRSVLPSRSDAHPSPAAPRPGAGHAAPGPAFPETGRRCAAETAAGLYP